MTIEQLRTLQAVSKAGSFTAAARALGRVQAAVSQSIERLEGQLGLRLFDRSSRVPRLTRDGAAVVAVAARIHDDVAALDDLVASLKRGAETKLAIVVDSMFPATALVLFAKEFARTQPKVDLVVLTETLSAVAALVREKGATLGIAGEDADLTGLDRRRVGEIRLVPVAATSHPLARVERPIGASALARVVQIVLTERIHDESSPTIDQGVFSPRTWRVADLATKLALIRGGLGWGHMPEPMIRTDVRARRLVNLDLETWGSGPPRRALCLVRRRGAVLGPVARWAEGRISELCRVAIATGASAVEHAE